MQLYAPLSALCAAALLVACSDAKAPAADAPPAAAPVAAAATPAPAAPTLSAERKVLQTLLSHEGLGMNLAYIEKHAGPAIRSDGHTHSLEIEHCQLELTTDEQNRSVQHIRLALTPQCTATSEGLWHSEQPVLLHTLTYQGLQDAYSPGAFSADCLRSCGNAVEPTVYFSAEGSRANNFLTLVLEASMGEGDTWEKAQPWIDTMAQQEGEDWIIDAGFNCEPYKYKDVAMAALASVRPGYLSFGESPLYPSCEDD